MQPLTDSYMWHKLLFLFLNVHLFPPVLFHFIYFKINFLHIYFASASGLHMIRQQHREQNQRRHRRQNKDDSDWIWPTSATEARRGQTSPQQRPAAARTDLQGAAVRPDAAPQFVFHLQAHSLLFQSLIRSSENDRYCFYLLDLILTTRQVHFHSWIQTFYNLEISNPFQ